MSDFRKKGLNPKAAGPCRENCDGLNVIQLNHGDPFVLYRECPHGVELKRRHADMTTRKIRLDVLSLIRKRQSK